MIGHPFDAAWNATMPKFDFDPLDFTQPTVNQLKRGLRWQWAWFDPQFHGLENLNPQKPALYVGNHTIFGGLDGPLMISGLYDKAGIYLRALGDRAHFYLPGWREMLHQYGVVLGTRENCSALMQTGQSILVYPGGGREVMKNRGEDYQLIWKERTGFAAMAMEHGYDIVPFGALGADEAYSIHYDANDFRASLLGRALTRSGLMDKYLRGGDLFNPLVTGVAGTLVPRPEKLYFGFGAPIPTAAYQSRYKEKEAQWEVRAKVEAAVYDEIDRLRAIREQDPDWSWWRRKLARRA